MSSAHSSLNIILCEWPSQFLNNEAVSNTELNKLLIRQPYFLCFFFRCLYYTTQQIVYVAIYIVKIAILPYPMGCGHYILCLLTFCTKFVPLGKKFLCNLLLRVFVQPAEKFTDG